MQIDQEPRRHSSSYELKPASRWWLVPAVAFCLLAIFNIGMTDWRGWSVLFFGVMLGFVLIFVFPKFWLSRLD